MDAGRRDRLLRELGVTRWVPRSCTPPHLEPIPSASASATARHAAEPATVDRIAAADPAVHAVTATASFAASPSSPGSPRYEPPQDWPGLRAAVAGCTRCKLCQTRNNTVFGVGPESSPLMVIGEGPGADEDARGEPFVGRGGKLLDEMLKAIGRSRRDDTFIANVVKCRPPGNRDPQAEEVEACRPYLDQQIRLLRPRLIVGLGRVAAQRLLATDQPMSKLRGQLHHYGRERTPVLLTYHPAYLLRSPREKVKAWADLKQIHRFLESAP